MKILVAVKRGTPIKGEWIIVVDHAAKVRVNPATQRIQLNNAKMELNPFCEIALEQAIRLKEMKFANEVDYYKAIDM